MDREIIERQTIFIKSYLQGGGVIPQLLSVYSDSEPIDLSVRHTPDHTTPDPAGDLEPDLTQANPEPIDLSVYHTPNHTTIYPADNPDPDHTPSLPPLATTQPRIQRAQQ